MTQRLPIAPNRPSQTFRVQLDGRTYRVQLDWSFAPEGWYLSLATAAGEPILSRRPVQPATFLLLDWVHPDRPAGELLVVGATDTVPQRSVDVANGIAPELTIPYEAMGTTVGLVYVPVADLATFIARWPS